MKKLLLLLIVGMPACKSVISIEGNVTNLPGNKVYISRQGSYKSAIDSSTVIDNKFSFTRKVGKKYFPGFILINTQRFDSIYQSPLYVYDNAHPLDSFHHVHNLFFFEKGKTIVTGNYKDDYVVIQSGPTNKLLFNFTAPSLRWAEEDIDSASRKSHLQSSKAFIQANPNSFFYFFIVDQDKYSFSLNELGELLPLFSKSVLQTTKGKHLKEYYAFKLKNINPYTKNFKLTDVNNLDNYVLNKEANLTLINFWASWCQPCQKEIPEFKSLYNKYHQQGLNIISISIDKSSSDWHKALTAYEMPWFQYIIPEKEREKWIQLFDAYAIPKTIILSKDFQVLNTYYGLDEKNTVSIDSIIYKSLLKKLTE